MSAPEQVGEVGLTGARGGGLWPRMARTVLISQLVAIPVALLMTSARGDLITSLGIATVYSQIIGLACVVGASVMIPHIRGLAPLAFRAAITAQFFLCGAAGAEIARRVCPLLFGAKFESGPPLVSWAIGATIAVIVGFVLVTVQHLRTRVLATELEALQARINPHFLFNTLNSIAALIREDPQRAEAMTLQLSALFRYTLQAPKRGLVTLQEEAFIVEGYLAIEQERLGERLAYRLDLDPALLQVRLPALILQPLVENAVKHGIATAVAGGEVVVRGWLEDRAVHLTVVDSGDGTGAAGGTGEGLENVRRRLRGAFGRSARVTLHHQDGRTEAHLTFPMGAGV
jgi:hypothetical protein